MTNLDRFAIAISEPVGGRYLTVAEAAIRIGLAPERGRPLMYRLRESVGLSQAR